jgi:hypothetical protein
VDAEGRPNVSIASYDYQKFVAARSYDTVDGSVFALVGVPFQRTDGRFEARAVMTGSIAIDRPMNGEDSIEALVLAMRMVSVEVDFGNRYGLEVRWRGSTDIGIPPAPHDVTSSAWPQVEQPPSPTLVPGAALPIVEGEYIGLVAARVYSLDVPGQPERLRVYLEKLSSSDVEVGSNTSFRDFGESPAAILWRRWKWVSFFGCQIVFLSWRT